MLNGVGAEEGAEVVAKKVFVHCSFMMGDSNLPDLAFFYYVSLRSL